MSDTKRVIVIDENTRIPVKLAWTGGVALVTIACTFVTVLVKQDAATAELKETKVYVVSCQKYVQSVDRRLARIEGAMGISLPPKEE